MQESSGRSAPPSMGFLGLRLKPHRTEAIQRMRVNTVCLIALLLVTTLLPIPGLLSSISYALNKDYQLGFVSHWMSIAEFLAFCVFLFNIAEAGWAIKYPAAPLPPTPKQTRQMKSPQSTTSTPKAFKLLASNSSPQPQKPFSFSPAASFSSSLSASGSAYPPSPFSTPSRTLNYSTLSNSSGFASSTSTVGYSPSPVVSAYRGKHFGGRAAQPLDGSYLGRVFAKEAEEREDEDD